MLAPSQRYNKRSRSPSSSGSEDIPSAYDGFFKRRKRANIIDPFWCEQPHIDGQPSSQDQDDHGLAESSSSPWSPQVGIERRRTRQWQRLNAPPRSTSTPFSNNSQPLDCPTQQPSSPVSIRCRDSPLEHQPEPAAYSRGQLSSSPVRHCPPGSSPFRQTSETQVEECMDSEEMRREWGEEYAAQNSLLYSLVSLLDNSLYPAA